MFPILIYKIIVENVYCICDIPCQNNPMNIKYLSTCLKFETNVFHGLKNIAKQKVSKHYHSKHNQDYFLNDIINIKNLYYFSFN